MEHLAATCDATPDKMVTLKDRYGIPHKLFEVTRAFINTLKKSHKHLRLCYIPYCRRSGNTRVTAWEFPKLGKLRHAMKYRAAQKWVRSKTPKP